MEKTACVILAGGRGKRMASEDTHKVCFPILGRPAICRAIDAYKQAGIRHIVVVVGQMAQQVIATVSQEFPEATFVFQNQPRGTGHATQVAVRALEAQGFDGNVVVTMGDKVVSPAVITDLMTTFREREAGVAVATLPFEKGSAAGRVVLDEANEVVGIIEKSDVERARRENRPVDVAGVAVSIDDLDRLTVRRNGSLYCYRLRSLSQALHRLDANNAQGELYVTDTIGLIRAAGERVAATEVASAEDLMGFNTPAELIDIEQILRFREELGRIRLAGGTGMSEERLHTAGEWLRMLRDGNTDLYSVLSSIYGAQSEAIEEQTVQISRVVEGFVKRYGPDRKILICRAPGRINLMGRHIEHRGGDINVMAISREVIVAAAPRDDDCVNLCNLDATFPDRRFHIREMLEATDWKTWVDFVDSHTVRQVLHEAPGDWSHYARAPLMRLQHEARGIPLKGMDCVVGGNIPMGAGLSSSSALVVAFAEAAIAFNALDMKIADFIDLCGEGEWFVGSRGGNGDHAAISTGRIGSISRIGFFPVEFKEQVPVPDHLRVVIAHSGSEARKSAGAKDAFNHRIASYEIAQMLLKRVWPAAAAMGHLRDLCPGRLKVCAADIYRALKLLPNRPDRDELRRLCAGADAERLERLFSTHADIGPYNLRGIVIYGISECMRSESFARALADGDLAEAGRLMAVSHDGDRVVRRLNGGAPSPSGIDFDDTRLDLLAAADADLLYQAGTYACSTEAIDDLVDRTRRVPGVIGVQLSGAGLGGCVMILTEVDAVDGLTEHLDREYYRPRNLESRLYCCLPVQGAGILRLASDPVPNGVLAGTC